MLEGVGNDDYSSVTKQSNKTNENVSSYACLSQINIGIACNNTLNKDKEKE